MKKYLYAGMLGIVLGTITGIAGAAESRTIVRKLPNGATETCKIEQDFITLPSGEHIIRRAWRCVTVKAEK